jgi:hypothetical protein
MMSNTLYYARVASPLALSKGSTSSLCSAYTYYVGGASLERSKYVVYTYYVGGAALERSKYVV